MQKILTDEDEDYLDFIRGRGCLLCDRPSEAHHQAIRYHGSVSAKCSDYRALPLCHDHHVGGGTSVQPGSVHGWGWSFWKQYGIDPDVVVVELNQIYFFGEDVWRL